MLTPPVPVDRHLDHLQTLIENHPSLLDAEFDQALDDLEREIEELRQRLNH